MKLLKHNTVIDWKNLPDASSNSFPGIAVTPSGRIIVSWRNAPQKESLVGQCVLCSISDDGGNSWSEPKNMFSAPDINGCKGSFRAGYPAWKNGRLYMVLCWVDYSVPERPFFKEENQGLLDCRIFISESTDDGDSWSEPFYVDSAPFDKFSTPITGAVSAFSDGELFVQFELNNPYDSDEEWHHLPVLKFSTDSGKSFARHAIPAADPANNIFYWDQRPVVLKDDTLADFFWTWDNASNSYLNIHMSSSFDRGMNWSEPVDTGIAGQAGQPVEFSDGTLLLVLVDRSGVPKIITRISSDKGKTFSSEILEISGLDKKQTSVQSHVNGAWSEMGKFSLGLPCGTASNHNSAYIVWYEGESTDRTNIKFAEVTL